MFKLIQLGLTVLASPSADIWWLLKHTHTVASKQYASYWNAFLFYFPQTKLWEGNVSTAVCLFIGGKGWWVTSNASWDSSHLPPSHRHQTWGPTSPALGHHTLGPTTPCLFKLVHFGTSPSGSDIWWCHLKLNHVGFPSGRYASYWNAVLLYYLIGEKLILSDWTWNEFSAKTLITLDCGLLEGGFWNLEPEKSLNYIFLIIKTHEKKKLGKIFWLDCNSLHTRDRPQVLRFFWQASST